MFNWLTSPNEEVSGLPRRKKPTPIFKMLLIGCGESGKSTFHRQVRIGFGEKVPEKEKPIFKATIFANLMESVYQICVKCLQRDKAFENDQIDVEIQKIF
jgi:hypothetical protein